MTTTENKRVVERFDDLFGRDDLAELDELCTPDMVNHALAPDRPAGLEGTREFLRTQAKQFQGQSWTRLTIVAEGDYVAQFGSRGGTWTGGSLLGVDAPAGDYDRDFACMYRLEGGRIAERWAIRDDLGMFRQLGALRTTT
ncbi:MAG TPA: ester cyclase [Microthrixaceae bacterium]|nr:ester cyclase [Microthrixaceae bacterium]